MKPQYLKYTSIHYVHIKHELKGQNLSHRKKYYLSIESISGV